MERYKNKKMVTKFNNNDKKLWSEFRLQKSNTISRVEFRTICLLHSQYYQHKYAEPCVCNPHKINQWIKDLNIIWENGVK